MKQHLLEINHREQQQQQNRKDERWSSQPRSCSHLAVPRLSAREKKCLPALGPVRTNAEETAVARTALGPASAHSQTFEYKFMIIHVRRVLK